MTSVISFQRLYSLSELMIALLNGLENVVLKIAFLEMLQDVIFCLLFIIRLLYLFMTKLTSSLNNSIP